MTSESGKHAGTPVTLEQMLTARDQRAERQQTALADFGLPIASLGAVMPGPIKDNAQSRIILSAAIESLDALFAQKRWPVRYFVPIFAATGPEALYVVDTDARDLKRALVDLEDSHPLGRLWDLDVISPTQGILSRRAFGLPPRRCLVCGAEAHACARSQKHALPQLFDVIEQKVAAYRHDSET